MIDRIKELMEAKGLTSTQLADGVDVPRAVVSHILSGRNKPSLDVMVKILSVHRDVNTEWLLLGEGSMYAKNFSSQITSSNSEKAAAEAENLIDTIPRASPSLENIPSGKVVPNVQPAAAQASKTLERIVYFYSDKTFEAYMPG
ncbi:helix-turn-helix transcriptional regulator [Pontibacter qinzhouensis]|uniref:Helix-turn-helix transcriptional regulator n=1 Tax=Pontibacter qinzhouensis TaxID=2603253 RepID=A0A5C8KAW7_9BACT|nr:helix-turn-helix transcriptional regulator [Pontibacter qinzhouensis]TXK46944.1 helix-turn-helix transcriptional regulator [Pontibacter qinzhouensis]